MNRRIVTAIAVSLSCAAAWMAFPHAQSQKADWLTDGGDPQRTAWQRNETHPDDSQRQGHEAAVEDQARQPDAADARALSAADRRQREPRSAGPKEIAVVAGVSDNIYGIDVEKGAVAVEAAVRQHLSRTPPQPGGRGGSVLCPGGLTATPVHRPAGTPGKYIVYAVSWDGRLRKLDVATGEEIEPPALFVPPNGKPYGLNLVNGVIYTATAQGCGGNPEQLLLRTISRRRRSATGRRAAAACGRGPDRRSARTARSTPAAATATTTPSSRSTARR